MTEVIKRQKDRTMPPPGGRGRGRGGPPQAGKGRGSDVGGMRRATEATDKTANDFRSPESKVLQGVSVISHDGDVLTLAFDDACASELVGCLNNDIKEVVRQFQEKNRFSPEFIPEMAEIIATCVRDLVKNAVASQIQLGFQKSGSKHRETIRKTFKSAFFQSVQVLFDEETEAIISRKVKDQLKGYRPQSSPHHLLKDVKELTKKVEMSKTFNGQNRPQSAEM
ncbi:uncharacterized protein LOC134848015 [Symsagittifera roscoffensis]|uniref:uncharacterized protein LOC134848015 n=1 Tax=Symsagittifera roscoffensis TaxID=84072 RepID=UPI00307BE50A